ncbi:MAG: hypothetical protein H7239_01495 [Flavobacterium sp.]|nr:hypothetical protein [Flavobacterium sp.]
MISEILEMFGLIASLPKVENNMNNVENENIEWNKVKLFSDPGIIENLISWLNIETSDEENWSKTYSGKYIYEKWLSYYVLTFQQGGGTKVLIKLPIPSTEELINIVIDSKYENEVETGCLILIDNEEIYKTEFRLELITKLENITVQKRQQKIIEITNLTSNFNRREIIGKTINQISEDEKYFKDIAEKAKKINTAGNS